MASDKLSLRLALSRRYSSNGGVVACSTQTFAFFVCDYLFLSIKTKQKTKKDRRRKIYRNCKESQTNAKKTASATIRALMETDATQCDKAETQEGPSIFLFLERAEMLRSGVNECTLMKPRFFYSYY